LSWRSSSRGAYQGLSIAPTSKKQKRGVKKEERKEKKNKEKKGKKRKRERKKMIPLGWSVGLTGRVWRGSLRCIG
jgi:hypothetical protein